MAVLRVNQVDGPLLWDERGREWTCKWVLWCSVKNAKAFLSREAPVGFVDDLNVLAWSSAADARARWSGMRDMFEVPGVARHTAPEAFPSWAAHVYRHQDERRLVFVLFT